MTRKEYYKKNYWADNSPRGNKKGCLCRNGKYSRKCCKGEIMNQGI